MLSIVYYSFIQLHLQTEQVNEMICCYTKYNLFQMNICQQNPLSGQAFQQVNDILDDDQSPSEVQILTFKINQMQKIITTLTRTNERLINRIQQLEDEMQEKNTAQQTTSFNEEYSVMQCDFNDIEEMIKEYRKQLSTYQEKVEGQLKEKTKTIQFLKQENDELKASNDKLKIKIEELQMQKDMLLQTKDNLLNQIQQLQTTARKSSLQSAKYSNQYMDSMDYGNKYDDKSNDFNTNVQRQLQKLIEKLVKQLQHERYLKKKLTEEVRKLQKDVVEQEKQLMNKNTKIYAMEMNAIKKNKTNNLSLSMKPRYDSKVNSKVNEQRTRYYRQKEGGAPSSPTSKSKTFTLMELMNQCIVLTSKEKLIIASKIIDFFLKKFQKYDYSSQILQSIMIWNFNPINPHLCTVKLNKQIQRDYNNEERDYSEAEGIWNLAFILDNLFNQTDTKDHDFGLNEIQETIIDTIMFMLENKDQNMLRTVLDLQRTVQSSISEQNQ